jgi:inosine triphosphate pyrophosphatase
MRAALCRARVASPPTRRRVVASRAAMDVTFVTSNARKLAEARAILGATPALTLTSRALDLPELQGEPEDVARAKARRAAVVVNGPALVEDTSLCYDALGGLPGVYVKWFLEKTGPEGLVDALAAYDDKSAEALCVLAYATGPDDETPRTFVGRTRGRIVRPRGSRDFGWDCVFEPEGRAETYAEMDAATKNSISHRYRAFELFRAHVANTA